MLILQSLTIGYIGDLDLVRIDGGVYIFRRASLIAALVASPTLFIQESSCTSGTL